MYKIIDKNIHITRGDEASIKITGDVPFKAGDSLKLSIVKKGDYKEVLFQKKYDILEDCESFYISLTSDDTRFGDVISKRTVYWYEIEYNDNQTIIGYDTDGAKQFILYPEADDKVVV